MVPLNLGWKERSKQELALMDELSPVLHKLAKGREISGLDAYEDK
jgi:type I restriction enzyme R subunit